LVGKSYTPGGNQSAFLWTLGGGTQLPGGLEATNSYLVGINALGQAAGGSFFSGVSDSAPCRWQDAGDSVVIDVLSPLPDGFDYYETFGIGANGSVLLLLDKTPNAPQFAAWDGAVTELVGPSFGVADARFIQMNASGEIAILIQAAGGGAATIYYVPSAGSAFVTYPMPSNGAVFSFQFNDQGDACFASGGQIELLKTRTGVMKEFTGNRPRLNNSGQLVFTDQGNLYFWETDSAANPQSVPLVLPPVPEGGKSPDLVGFNNDGQIASVIFPNNGSAYETLTILNPVVDPPPTPTPTPTPPPKPTPTPAPAPTPTPNPNAEKIASKKKAIANARRIPNPQARARTVARLQEQLKRLERSNQNLTPQEQQIERLKQSLENARRIPNPEARVRVMSRLRAQIKALESKSD